MCPYIGPCHALIPGCKGVYSVTGVRCCTLVAAIRLLPPLLHVDVMSWCLSGMLLDNRCWGLTSKQNLYVSCLRGLVRLRVTCIDPAGGHSGNRPNRGPPGPCSCCCLTTGSLPTQCRKGAWASAQSIHQPVLSRSGCRIKYRLRDGRRAAQLS
jgi:hypothetical protein